MLINRDKSSLSPLIARDYFEAGANVFVEIYDDRIEVSNPGGLPKGLTRAEFGTRSIRRNALIADLLQRISFIEKAGTGIRRMREEAKKNGCPEPTFEANGFFTATFRPLIEQVPHKYHTSTEQVTPHVTPQVTPQVEQVPHKYRTSYRTSGCFVESGSRALHS